MALGLKIESSMMKMFKCIICGKSCEHIETNAEASFFHEVCPDCQPTVDKCLIEFEKSYPDEDEDA